MTATNWLEEEYDTSPRHEEEPWLDEQGEAENVGQAERVVSVAAGAILTVLGLSRRSLPGYLVAGLGGALAYRGLSGHCPAYGAMGINTADDEQQDAFGSRAAGQVEERIDERGIHVEQAFLINRSPEDLYQFWRDFSNLPSIMTHLKSVEVREDGRSRWTVDAPFFAGGEVSWEAEVTRDEPNSAIAWRSVDGSTIDTKGEIRFSKAMGDRGTEVHVYMEYVPPGGRVGHWLAKLFGKAPRRQMRQDLRNFKRLMETGEIISTQGQPRGKCLTGGGRREGM